MSIYFRSSLGIAFPKSPYIGQIYYDPDLKRTFRYEEKDFGDCILKSTIDWFHWVDIQKKTSSRKMKRITWVQCPGCKTYLSLIHI